MPADLAAEGHALTGVDGQDKPSKCLVPYKNRAVYTLGGHLRAPRGRRRWRGEMTAENRNVPSGNLTSMDGRERYVGDF
jgi:hypothetical protein